MSVQFIATQGRPEYAVIPVADYERLLEKATMLDDVLAFDQAVAKDEESIPSEMVMRLVAGENKIKVWRVYRGLTQAALAERAEIAQAMVAQLEAGKRTGSIQLLRRVADGLGIYVDDLL